MVKKFIMGYVVGLFVGAIRAFVLMNLWNWFVSSTFQITQITFLEALGLTLLAQLILDNGQEFSDMQRWTLLMRVLDFCVPDDNKEYLSQAIKEIKDSIWMEATIGVFTSVCGYAVLLAFGYLIHLLTN
jgi:hypothetical protein